MPLEAAVRAVKARNPLSSVLRHLTQKVDGKTFLYMLAFQGLYFLIISTNILFLTERNWQAVMVTDAIGGLINFGLIQHIAKATGRWATAGYVIGSATGSGLAIPFTGWLMTWM